MCHDLDGVQLSMTDLLRLIIAGIERGKYDSAKAVAEQALGQLESQEERSDASSETA